MRLRVIRFQITPRFGQLLVKTTIRNGPLRQLVEQH